MGSICSGLGPVSGYNERVLAAINNKNVIIR